MRDNQAPQTIRLVDYTAPRYWITETTLHFDLHDEYTQVDSTLRIQANPAADGGPHALVLDGVDLVLERLVLAGQVLRDDQYSVTDETLRLEPEVLTSVPGVVLEKGFELNIVTRIYPQQNTSLEGLYVSNGMYCTQCEAEGFRKITYYLDRPDVMSRFTTTIEADKQRFPQLLSNGNLLEAPDLDKVDHAMLSLKRAMAWDETVYGREYDLDIYMIVAVSHFNMGAMENKGLNIFNTSCVLANTQTATDTRFQRVEGVIAHEYFHNWSGNRVTCRDWFQLSLKEGFTVFRDQEFSADMGSRAIKRVEDVRTLRTHQFAEDAGPMAHPVRPDAYMEINNFYTVTVYEKGAEVVRMIHTLLGPEGFRRGSDLYFKRYDGHAVTCEDFLSAMEEANGEDFTRFRPWYSQAGTPVVRAQGHYDAPTKTYCLTMRQETPATPGQAEKAPVLIPVKMALLGQNGQLLPLTLGAQPVGDETVLRFEQAEQTVLFEQVEEKPLPSLLRGFSAPVHLQYDYSAEELTFLSAHDSDPFNRWEAMDQLVCDALISQIDVVEAGGKAQFSSLIFEAFERILLGEFEDKGEQAQLLSLPTEAYLSQKAPIIAVEGLHGALRDLRRALAARFSAHFSRLYEREQSTKAYSSSSEDMMQRLLKNTCLRYLASPTDEHAVPVGLNAALNQFSTADNMTDQFAALSALVLDKLPGHEDALAAFYDQWKDQALVVDMWFGLQASAPQASTLGVVQGLVEHEAFDWKSPNKIRSVVASFASANPTQFHRRDGAGYAFLFDVIVRLNRTNPHMAARLVTPFTQWRRYDAMRQAQLKGVLQDLQNQPDLSSDVYELVNKSLSLS
ncbi:MAG: aminopeptidase N [Gammaproteobacteria bacterium]